MSTPNSRKWSLRLHKARSANLEESQLGSDPSSFSSDQPGSPLRPSSSDGLVSPSSPSRSARKLNVIPKKLRRGSNRAEPEAEASKRKPARPALPPAGYLWLYIGRFQRWKRRFFVLDAEPGSLHYYNSASRRGPRWAINLRGASVVLTGKTRRQFAIISGSSLIYCRTLEAEQRQVWLDCVQASISAYATMNAASKRLSDDKWQSVTPGSPRTGTSPPASGSTLLTSMARTSPQAATRAHHRTPRLLVQRDDGVRSVRTAAETHAKLIMERHLAPLQKSVEASLNASVASAAAAIQSISFSSASPGEASPFGPGAESSNLCEAWRSLRDTTRIVVEQLTLQIAELKTENVALSKSIQQFQHERTRKATMDSEDTGDSSDDEGDFGGAGVALDGFMDGMDIPAEPKLYHEALKAMRRRKSEDFSDEDLEVMAAPAPHVSLSNAFDGEEDEEDEDEDEDEEDEDEDDEDEEDEEELLQPFNSLIINTPLPDISEHPCEGSTPLPAPSPQELGFSLWRKLQKHIGRSVTSVMLPATVNEPLSGLQKLAEEVEHHALLSAAILEPDSALRLARVAAFALSPFNSSLRTRIPLVPLLGETFEFVSDDGVRFLAEQVSLSPPTAAWWAEGEAGGWRMWGDLCLRTKFWGKHIEASFGGEVHLELPGTGDHYVWSKPSCWVHNIILGNIWVEWHGKMTVTNIATSEAATVRLPKCNRMPGRRGYISGSVAAADGSVKYKVNGNYLDRITAIPDGADPDNRASQIVLYTRLPGLPDAEEQYNFTAFTLRLKFATDSEMAKLPPTDSRHRSDEKALEQGRWEEATSEKLRLSTQQRQRIKASSRELSPAWFRRSEDDSWRFTGEYWAARESQDWGRSPTIF